MTQAGEREGMSKQIQVHVGIEREISYAELGAYSCWVITGVPFDIYVRGTDPEDVRSKLRNAILEHAQKDKLSIELPPRRWTEGLDATLPDESADNIDFIG
jgi:hypothetical protein